MPQSTVLINQRNKPKPVLLSNKKAEEKDTSKSDIGSTIKELENKTNF